MDLCLGWKAHYFDLLFQGQVIKICTDEDAT